MSNRDVIYKAIQLSIHSSSHYPVQLKAEYGGHKWKIMKRKEEDNYFLYKDGIVWGECHTAEEVADAITGAK